MIFKNERFYTVKVLKTQKLKQIYQSNKFVAIFSVLFNPDIGDQFDVIPTHLSIGETNHPKKSDFVINFQLFEF